MLTCISEHKEFIDVKLLVIRFKINMDLENYFIGKAKESDEYHKFWYVKRKELLPIAKLKQNELEHVEWQSGVKVSDCIYDSRAKLCLYRYQVFIERFEKRQTKCCNIFQCHNGVKIPKARHLITLAMAKTLVNQYNKNYTWFQTLHH